VSRANLLWFAGGAATSSLAAVVALSLKAEDAEPVLELTISEPQYTQSSKDGLGEKPWRGAEIARDCGAQALEMVPTSAADATDYTRIPLGSANLPSVHCILDKGSKAGLWLDIISDPNAQTH
jgi:hypothetical protein